MKFKVRGGKLWRVFFWWDYRLPTYILFKIPKAYIFFKYTLRSWRFKRYLINHVEWEKDRLLFWRKAKKTGAKWF